MRVDPKNILNNLKNIFRRELAILWIFSVVAGFALIVLANKGKLPLGKGDFIFLSALALLVALWKPRWIFFLFVAAAGLENVILAGGFLPVQIRPYQFLGGVLIVAVLILFISRQNGFKILKPSWFDWLVFSLAPLTFLSLVNSSNKSASLKNNLVLLSFIALYFLARNFLKSRNDLTKAAAFFFGSNIVVVFYGFFQVFADKIGSKSFEVMFGRPNSTFTEPDWLGIYLVFSLAALFAAITHLETRFPSRVSPPLPRGGIKGGVIALIFLNLALLILTLSRSAWIGAGVVIFFWLLFSLRKSDNKETSWALNKFANNFLVIFLIFLASLAAIHFGKLSKFDLLDRARSTATSEQKITIACEKNADIPQIISNVSDLEKFGCSHINLEEIETQKSQGKFVAEIFRKDPNVMTRGQIYRKSWDAIKSHPILGVGFGTITQILGADERGAGLNESNIFLQVWAGCGILGLIAFIAAIGYLFIYAFRRASPICLLNKIIGYPAAKNDFEKALNVFAALGIIALVIPNLFNAGLLMGISWIGLAVIASININLSSRT